jgi:cytidylate kinase
MFPYPDNVGIVIPVIKTSTYKDFSTIDLSNTILTIYGLPSTGKGTLSKIIAKRLNLPVFDTGVLYRVFTFFVTSQNLEVSEESILKFKESINLDLKNGKITTEIFGKEIENHQIRNPEIDKKMGDFTKLPIVRAAVDELIAGFVLKSPFVTDGRGAFDGYLVQAERQGIRVIRVLLQAQQNERVRRRFIDYLALERGNELTSKDVENLWKKCEEVVKYRDEEEVLKDKTLGLGMISEDSGILDTTNLSIEEAAEAVLGWVNSFK